MDSEKDRGNFSPAKPPRGLLSRIKSRIQAEKKLMASRRRAVYFSIALGASLASFATTLFALQGALLRSEMLSALSLVFSDPATVLAEWRDFSLFLLEALPVGYLALFLAALFAMLESTKYIAKSLSETVYFSKMARK